MMRKAAILLTALALLSAQSPSRNFPPGTFNNRAALDGSIASGYTGPGDVVTGAFAFWGLRAYNAAYATSLGKLVNVCLAADAACGDLNSDVNGNLVNVAVGGSLCSVVTCTIKTFYDQSGATNCTTACDLTQATESKRPILTFSCSGAKPCATNTATQGYATANTSVTLTQAFTITTGAKRTSQTTYSTIVANTNGSLGLYFGNGANLADVYTGTDHTFAQTDGTWHRVIGVFNGTSSSGTTDGSTTSISAATTGFGATTPLRVLCDNGACTQDVFFGTVVEIGVWQTAFSAGNITSMDSNISTYWGF